MKMWQINDFSYNGLIERLIDAVSYEDHTQLSAKLIMSDDVHKLLNCIADTGNAARIMACFFDGTPRADDITKLLRKNLKRDELCDILRALWAVLVNLMDDKLCVQAARCLELARRVGVHMRVCAMILSVSVEARPRYLEEALGMFDSDVFDTFKAIDSPDGRDKAVCLLVYLFKGYESKEVITETCKALRNVAQTCDFEEAVRGLGSTLLTKDMYLSKVRQYQAG